MKKLLFYAIIFVFFLPIETSAQRKKEENKKGKETTNTIEKNKAILYTDVVNEGTKTDEGLFKVHENKENHYATIDMMGDLRRGIFSEIRNIKNVDLHRRNLQKSFINRLSSLMKDVLIHNTDIPSIIRGELTTLKYQLNAASKKTVNKITNYHYKDCIVLINNILDPK